MRLSERSLEVAGGVILLVIAMRMVFADGGGIYAADSGREPFIFPLAVPLLAGPSAMATVLLLASRQPERMDWVGAVTAPRWRSPAPCCCRPTASGAARRRRWSRRSRS
jgi:small neutral amino acid transporter SnatA (MarC family)